MRSLGGRDAAAGGMQKAGRDAAGRDIGGAAKGGKPAPKATGGTAKTAPKSTKPTPKVPPKKTPAPAPKATGGKAPAKPAPKTGAAKGMGTKKPLKSSYDPTMEPNYNPLIEGYANFLNNKLPYEN